MVRKCAVGGENSPPDTHVDWCPLSDRLDLHPQSRVVVSSVPFCPTGTPCERQTSHEHASGLPRVRADTVAFFACLP
jgi:hypothetical protein